MRKIIDSSSLLKNDSFLMFFLSVSFPEGITSEDDALSELMNDKYYDLTDVDYINSLTGYYDGIFDESDGYIDDPNTIRLTLSDGSEFFIELHPGDDVYFLGETQLGCTGPEYSIRAVDFERFKKLTENLTNAEKLLVLPMVRVEEGETEAFSEIVRMIISEIGCVSEDVDDITDGIVSNCLVSEED